MDIESTASIAARNLKSKAQEALGRPKKRAEKKTKKSRITIKRRQRSAQYFTEELNNIVSLQMMLILGGEFTMGAPETELDSRDSERPQHKVTVPTFFIGKYPVTQEQWQAIIGNNPSRFKGDKLPVESVSWNAAQQFCDRLSERTSRKYRLPSEAEWEYACRAGTKTPFHFGETISTDLANYRATDWEIDDKTYPGNYGKGKLGIFREKTTEVGSFPPNYYGLCDMHGNVWEWCEDTWHSDYKDAPSDGSFWVDEESSNKVIRSGSWDNDPDCCRSATRNYVNAKNNIGNFGFRVVCVVPRTS